ncbi:hypothetical protein LINPERHAP1_LOCUS41951, partial [Linum perenne]
MGFMKNWRCRRPCVTSQPFLTRYCPLWAKPSQICFWVLVGFELMTSS